MPTAPVFDEALIIPGAQKSGTTLLFKMLSKSPALSIPAYKEPQFWALAPDTVERQLDWYRGLFDNPDGKLFEASTFYLFFPQRSASLINRWIEEPQFIITLRDPVQRAYSAYFHKRKHVPVSDERNFQEILMELGTLVSSGCLLKDAERTLALDALCQGDIRRSILDRDYLHQAREVDFESTFPDMLAAFLYFTQSCYRHAIETYRDVFSDDQIHIVFFEQLIAEPEPTFKGILDFAQLPYPDELSDLPIVNPTRPVRSWIREVVKWGGQFTLFDRSKQLLKRFQVREQLEELFLRREKPSLDRESYQKGRQLLSDEYDYWLEREEKVDELWTYDR